MHSYTVYIDVHLLLLRLGSPLPAVGPFPRSSGLEGMPRGRCDGCAASPMASPIWRWQPADTLARPVASTQPANRRSWQQAPGPGAPRPPDCNLLVGLGGGRRARARQAAVGPRGVVERFLGQLRDVLLDLALRLRKLLPPPPRTHAHTGWGSAHCSRHGRSRRCGKWRTNYCTFTCSVFDPICTWQAGCSGVVAVLAPPPPAP